MGGKKEKREEKRFHRDVNKEFSLHFFSSTQKEELKGGKNHSLEHEREKKIRERERNEGEKKKERKKMKRTERV